MRRVLVLGAGGMLGHMVAEVLSGAEGVSLTSTSRHETAKSLRYSVEEGMSPLRAIVAAHGPFDYFVNCVGMLHHEIDPANPDSVRRAILVNALFPHDLAALGDRLAARLIHISTDAVFSRKAAVCVESTPPDGSSVYARTKSLGEVSAPNALTFRCSIIGPSPLKKSGLFEWFRTQPPSARVQGYTDHAWSGVTTLQFADLCRRLIVEDLFAPIRGEAAVHHFCPNETLTKFQLLEILRALVRPDLEVEPSVDGDGSVSRSLQTQYQAVRRYFGDRLPMRTAIERLSNHPCTIDSSRGQNT